MKSNGALVYPNWFVPVAGSVVGALLLAFGVVPAAQAEPSDASSGDAQSSVVAADNPVAGDAVSASVNARLLGEKVEVLSSRTSTSLSWSSV